MPNCGRGNPWVLQTIATYPVMPFGLHLSPQRRQRRNTTG